KYLQHWRPARRRLSTLYVLCNVRAVARRKALTIGQVARLLRLSPSVLRKWEKRGLVSPSRSGAGYRLYTKENLRQLKRIEYLRRVKGVNASGILQLQGRDAELQSEAEPPRINIGEQLLQLRTRLGLTLAQAAAGSDLTSPAVASIERGLTKPSIATLQ